MISNPNLKNSLDSTVSVMFQNLLSFQKKTCFDLDLFATEEFPKLLNKSF